jgi:hypothetical protein
MTRVRAATIHLVASGSVALVCAALVFGLWYPGAYRALSGGMGLFVLIVAIDLVLGPLLTLVVFNPRKGRSELTRDVGVIAIVQLVALGYGLFTMASARPVYLVFEVDRFRVVAAADIDPKELTSAPNELRSLPWLGPQLIAARRADDAAETLESVMSAAAGVDIAMRPSRWTPFDTTYRQQAWARAKPLDSRDLPEDIALKIDTQAASRGLRPSQLRLLPVQSRFASWSAAIDERGEPIAFVPLDGF